MRRNLLLAILLIVAIAAPSWSQGRTARSRGGDGGGGGARAQGAPNRGGELRGGGGARDNGGTRSNGRARENGGARDNGGARGNGAGRNNGAGGDNQAREPRRAMPAERATPADRGNRQAGGELPRANGSALAQGQRQRDPDVTLRRVNPGARYAVPRNGEARQQARRYDLPDRRQDGRRYDPSDRRPGDRRVYNNNYFYVAPGRSYAYRPPRVPFYYYSPFPRYRYDDRLFGWYGGVSGYGGYGFGYPTGELHLEVQPQWAQVYVDGYYAGTVDDFDGFGQGLRLEEGPYTIEIVAPGFEPLSFDVRIERGRQVTYEGDLIAEGAEPPFEPEP